MSGYQQVKGVDDSTIEIPSNQSRQQELSTEVGSSSNSCDSKGKSKCCDHSSQKVQQPRDKCCNDGHSHGHQHNSEASTQEDKCGHSHGSGESCKSKNKKKQENFIRFFTMFMPCNCIILEYFWLNDTLKGNDFEYFSSNLLMFWILFMCFVTYYQAVTIKNTPVKRQPPPCDPSLFDPVARNNAVCKDCQVWKPMRAKHCRNCGTCQLRMDHHCPWITNCVGLRNNRAFYLFTIYMMIGAVQYLYRTLIYFQYLNAVDDFWQNSYFFYIYWLFTTVILVPIGLMLVGLSVFHSILLVNNATTLDAMGGLSLGLPFSAQQRVPANKRSVNVFNRGLMSNIRDFFSGDLLLWWWPFTTYTPNDGTSYEMAPPCTFNDIQNTVRHQIINEDGLDLNSLVTDFDKRITEEKERLKECNLQVGDKIFELWKDIQKEENEKLRLEADKQLKLQQKQQGQTPTPAAEQVKQDDSKEITLL